MPDFGGETRVRIPRAIPFHQNVPKRVHGQAFRTAELVRRGERSKPAEHVKSKKRAEDNVEKVRSSLTAGRVQVTPKSYLLVEVTLERATTPKTLPSCHNTSTLLSLSVPDNILFKIGLSPAAIRT